MDDLPRIMAEQEAAELERLRRIEGGLQHGDVPKNPRQRIAELAAGTQHADLPSAALLQTVIHASTALRCRSAVLEAIADRTMPGATIRAIGEANMAAIALYLAATAARRACADLENPGPLGRRRLDELISTAEHMRDCVIHWSDKARAPSPAFLNVTEYDILVVGSDRGRPTLAGLPWKMFESYARRLRGWAEFHLDERIRADAAAVASGDPAGS